MGVAAVILGILAIVVAFFSTMLFGTTGVIITAVLAAVAILLGVLKRKNTQKGGIAGIVIAVIAIILAVCMASFWNSAFKTLHEKALELQPDGLWAQVSEDTTHGFMGLIAKLPTDEASLNQLMEEADELNKGISKVAETTEAPAEATEAPAEATEAPAEEAAEKPAD